MESEALPSDVSDPVSELAWRRLSEPHAPLLPGGGGYVHPTWTKFCKKFYNSIQARRSVLVKVLLLTFFGVNVTVTQPILLNILRFF